jgi:hypothetical protein
MRLSEEVGDGKTKRRDNCAISDVFARKVNAQEEAEEVGVGGDELFGMTCD